MQPKNQPLSQEEINRGKFVVSTLHPLAEVPLYQAVPFLKPFKRFFTSKVKQERKNLVLSDQLKDEESKHGSKAAPPKSKKNQTRNQFNNIIGNKSQDPNAKVDSEGTQEIPKLEFNDDEDPVNYLGFGIVSYFDLLKTMILVFFVLFMLHIPVMKIYSSHSNFAEDAGERLPRSLTLGNMGFSTTRCVSSSMQADKIILSCKESLVQKIVDFGLTTKFEDRDQCVRNKSSTCANSIDYGKLDKELSNCIGKQSCTVKNISTYVTANRQICAHEDTSFFVQYFCEQSEKQLSRKYVEGSIVAAIATFSCIFFIIMNFYLRRTTQIKQVEWDVATLTAGDYTVDMKIRQQQYIRFIQDHKNKYPNDSNGFALKKHLKQELEDKLTNEVPSQGFENIDRVRIADIQFSFKNGTLINTLKTRGQNIKDNNWAALKKTNETLDRVKNKEYQNLMVPVGAFITFESEEGLERCLSLQNNKTNLHILGERPRLKAAPEPTNIIWENRQYTTLSRFVKFVLVGVIIVMLLTLSFATIVSLKRVAKTANSKYQSANCKEVYEIYGETIIQDQAVEDWLEFYRPEKGIYQRSQVTGILDCFCKAQFKKYGPKLPYVEYSDNDGHKEYICAEWVYDFVLAKGINMAISVVLVAINFILKMILIRLIASIGEDTKSAQMRSIKVGVFLTQFFNTGILLLLTTANLSESKIPLLRELFKGPYTDFTQDWYRDVGMIITKAMCISAVMPIIEFFMFWTMKNSLRFLDRSFSKDHTKSKKKSIQLYIDIYSGPDYMIHFRYSTIMNISFVCMMYGTAMPMLYLIALFAFVVLYCMERVLVCYYYKQPPSFDEEMTMNTLNMLLWAPLIHMAFTYWFLSNNQIFDNAVFAFKTVKDVPLSGHTVVMEFSDLKFDQSIPCLVLCGILILLIPFGTIFTAIIDLVRPGLFKMNLNVDENLGPYFSALESEDIGWMVKEEENLRKNYKMKILLDETLQKLQRAEPAKQTITGVHCYDILANPEYQSAFQYVPADVPNRTLIIQDDDDDDSNDAIQCDIIKIALNMAMLNDDVSQKLSFQKEKLGQAFK